MDKDDLFPVWESGSLLTAYKHWKSKQTSKIITGISFRKQADTAQNSNADYENNLVLMDGDGVTLNTD